MKQKSICIILLCFFSLHADTNLPVRMYAIYTPSHEKLLNNWFLPSIKDDYELVLQTAPQTCKTTQYLSEGWKQTTLAKVDMIIEAIKKNWGHWFVYSDVDITFYQKTRPTLENLIQQYDIIIQRERPLVHRACTGFFACRANEKTLNLWQKVRSYMKKYAKESDQVAFNHALIKDGNPFGISYCILPEKEFMTGYGWSLSKNTPGNLRVDKDIVLHHANFAKGVPGKLKQLDYVRKTWEHLQQRELLNTKQR